MCCHRFNRRPHLDVLMVAGPEVSRLSDEFARSSGLSHSIIDERLNEHKRISLKRSKANNLKIV